MTNNLLIRQTPLHSNTEPERKKGALQQMEVNAVMFKKKVVAKSRSSRCGFHPIRKTFVSRKSFQATGWMKTNTQEKKSARGE